MKGNEMTFDEINEASKEVSELDPFYASARCVECDREFDLTNDDDLEEWHYGHDCEAK